MIFCTPELVFHPINKTIWLKISPSSVYVYHIASLKWSKVKFYIVDFFLILTENELMKIVIVGAGFTGLQLAKILVNEKNDVVLIDNDEERTKYASNSIDCSVLNADGNSLETLERAEISKADALVCVTESDEVNIVTCSLVDAIYPNVLKIARVRNYEYYVNRDRVNKAREKFHEKLNDMINDKLGEKLGEKFGEKFGDKFSDKLFGKKTEEEQIIEVSDLPQRPIYGIDFMIHPDVEAANAIVRAVENGAISDVITFESESDTASQILQITRVPIMEGSAFEGHKLMELRNITQIPMLIAYFEDNGVTRLPDGNTIMTPGCTLGILSEKKDLNAILALAGSKQKELRRIMLFGAGKIGTLVASKIIEPHQSSVLRMLSDQMLRRSQDVVLIDNDEALVNAASERFPTARVFRADASDENFLYSEGLNDFDLAICASHNHEMNMILAAFLESIGVKQSIGLVSSSSFTSIGQKLGIDVTIPLRDVIVDSIMSHLRGSAVKGVHTINEGNLEIIECEIADGSKVKGKTIREIAQSGKFLVLLLRTNEKENYQIVNGNTVLEAGNHLVLIALSDLSAKVLEIFGNQTE